MRPAGKVCATEREFAAPAPDRASLLWIAWNNHRRTTGLCAAWDVPLYIIQSNRRGLLRWCELAVETCKLLRRRGADLLFVQNPSLALTLLVTLVRPLFGYFLVVDAHNEGVRPFDRPYALVRWLSRRLLHAADITIVTNEALAVDVRAAGGRPLVLRDSLPVPSLPPGRRRRESDRADIVVIATYRPDEPIAAIIAAAATMPEVRFAFTGDVSRFRNAPRELPPNVRFTGFLLDDRFWLLLARANVICDLTLKPDCLVCGAYEAVAVGKPMVLSDNAPTREVFGSAAILTDNDPSDIARALRTALERRESLTMNACELRERFRDEWAARGIAAWEAIRAATRGGRGTS